MKNHPRRRGSRSCPDSSGPGAVAVSEGFTPAEVALGQQIRAAYILERSAYETNRAKVVIQWQCPVRWDGKAARMIDGEVAEGGKAIGPTWPKIARLLIDEYIDPERFVRWVFETNRLRSAPEPNHLQSPELIAAYLASVDPGEDRRRCTLVFASQRQRAAVDISCQKAVGATDNDAYVIVATDRSNGLSPLFRYCLAVIARQDDLAETFFPEAAIQYVRAQDDYTAVWGRHLPAGFCDRAVRYYSEVVKNEVPDDVEARPDL